MIGEFRTLSKIIFTKHSILNLCNVSEYVLSFKYVRVLNISELSICQGSEPISVNITVFFLNMHQYAFMEGFCLWQSSEYALSKFHSVLDMTPALNIPGLRIWQAVEYARVT